MSEKLAILSIFIMLLFGSLTSVAHADAAIFDCRSIYFSGSIAGKYPIVMDVGGEDMENAGVHGYYYYLKSLRMSKSMDEAPEIYLNGKTGKNGKVYENPDGNNKDKNYFVFENITNNKITGKWVNGKTGKALDFEVKSGPGIYSVISDWEIDGEKVEGYREDLGSCSYVIYGRISNGPLLPLAMGDDGWRFENPVVFKHLDMPGSLWLMKTKSGEEGSGKNTVTPIAIYSVEKSPQLVFWTEDSFGETGAAESSGMSTKVQDKDGKLDIEIDDIDSVIDQDTGDETSTKETWKYVLAREGQTFSLVSALHDKSGDAKSNSQESDSAKLIKKLIDADSSEFPVSYLRKVGDKYYVPRKE